MSTETETVFIKINLSSKWWNEPPKYEVLIDDTVYSYGEVLEKEEDGQIKTVMFSVDLPEGEHSVKVRLLNKLSRKHVVIDEVGNILKDQLINVKSIEIDEIELDNLIWTHSLFYKQISEEGTMPIYSDEPLVTRHPTFGWNGEFRLNFSVPTYMWFLENL